MKGNVDMKVEPPENRSDSKWLNKDWDPEWDHIVYSIAEPIADNKARNGSKVVKSDMEYQLTCLKEELKTKFDSYDKKLESQKHLANGAHLKVLGLFVFVIVLFILMSFRLS